MFGVTRLALDNKSQPTAGRVRDREADTPDLYKYKRIVVYSTTAVVYIDEHITPGRQAKDEASSHLAVVTTHTLMFELEMSVSGMITCSAAAFLAILHM